jgi:hypothetical protein
MFYYFLHLSIYNIYNNNNNIILGYELVINGVIIDIFDCQNKCFSEMISYINNKLKVKDEVKENGN